MQKRIGVAVLWYLAVGWGLNYLALITGFPGFLVYVLAIASAAFVAVDPAHLFWPARDVGAPTSAPVAQGPADALSRAA
jgi:hypothetical protein